MAQELYCMADNKIWTPELSSGTKAVYLKIVDAMAKDIADGTLAIGEKLPPQRQLAWHLGINLSTVTKAFQQAAKQQLIAGEVGRGTFVLAQSLEAKLFELNNKNPDEDIDLSTHVPVYASDAELEHTIKEISQDNKGLSNYLEFHSPYSLSRYTSGGAKWLASLGFEVPVDHCVITNTAQNALLVTLLASCSADDVVLVNEFTFPGVKALAKQLGLKLYGVKSDGYGMRPDSLDLAIRSTGAKVVVTDPYMQNPTAASMNKSRKDAFLDVISRYKMLFIEENVIGCLSGNPPLAARIPEQSIVITSFTKAIAPGLRFAVIAGQHPILQNIRQESHVTGWAISPLMAEVAYRWIESGIAESRRVWQMQQIVQRYRLFKQIFPGHMYKGNHQTCSHVWLEVNQVASMVANQLEKKGLRVVPSSLFSVGHHSGEFIRISLTAAKSLSTLKHALMLLIDSGFIRQSVEGD